MQNKISPRAADIAPSIAFDNLTRHADAVTEAFATHAGQLAAETALPIVTAFGMIHAEVNRRLKTYSADSFNTFDARAATWRVRIRLYAKARDEECEADTDPDSPADAPGAAIVRGLPGVADMLREVASGFQGGLVGLDDATLRHRLKSLRPTLSRRGGNAVWRVPYTSSGAEWLARVDIERAAT